MVLKKIIITISLIITLPILTIELCYNQATAATQGKNRCEKAELKLWEMKSLIQRKIFLENIIQECPNHAMLQYYYAVNLDRRQRYEKALHYYKLSTKLDALFPYVYFGMGETYLSLGNITDAIIAYQKGLKIQPDNKWGSKRINEIIVLETTSAKPSDNPSDSLREIKTAPVPDKYTKDIAERYGIQLEKLIHTKRQMASLKKIADRYDIQLDAIIKKKNSPSGQENQQDSSTNKSSNKTKNEKIRKKYLADISKRYELKFEELAKADKQMAALKKLADQYNLKLDDLIKTYKNNSIENGRFSSTTNENSTENEQVNIRKAYLGKISKRYGIQLGELEKINDRMGFLKAIAERYGIQIDNLNQSDKQLTLFDSEKSITKTHKVVKNEYLSEIATRYNVPMDDLIQANKQISDPNWIVPGQLIKIPEKKRSELH